MKKGSITVFLSLILVLLFAFLLTTLEAARIRGATAYLSMVSELAGDSFLASYYYPLFQHYRLFGVNAGDEEGFFSEDFIVDELKENVTYGMEEQEGGLLQFQATCISGINYKTMLSDGGKEFLSQVRQQAVLDGMSLLLQELFSEEQFTEAGVVGRVYREQEEALAVTATVTAELVKLMELVDGIRMKDSGIAFDRNGKMQAKEFFIKQPVTMEQDEVKASYDSAEVFRTISDKFFRADVVAKRIQIQLTSIDKLEKKIIGSENRISRYAEKKEAYEEKWEKERERLSGQENPDKTYLLKLEETIEALEAILEKEEDKRDDYEEQRDSNISKAKSQYNSLRQKLQGVERQLEDALDIVDRLEKKQKAAGIAVKAYEAFLEEIRPGLSEELYQVFYKELEKMKLYAGLEERGFSVDTMRKSLETDRALLQELSLNGFHSNRLWEAQEEMEAIIDRMDEYTVDGLWFSYGDIVVAETTRENVTGALGELLTAGVLSLVGVSKEEQSEHSISGVELPSAGLDRKSILKDLMACIDEVRGLFQSGGMGEVICAAGNAALDETALELYSMKYFHCYGEDSPFTRLKYEREYLIFGAKEDKSNLLSAVLHLVAIRTLLCMVMLLKQPDKMAQIEAFSMGVAGFTGIPVLVSALKYTILLLWSVEEALVEVSALLEGKRVAVAGTGTVAFSELFLMNKSMIERKARSIPEGVGASYQDYLSLLSLTKGTREKAYRAMDLIQENIRYRYNDGFRIRNVITQLDFLAETELKRLFNTGVFPSSVYTLDWKEEREY